MFVQLNKNNIILFSRFLAKREPSTPHINSIQYSLFIIHYSIIISYTSKIELTSENEILEPMFIFRLNSKIWEKEKLGKTRIFHSFLNKIKMNKLSKKYKFCKIITCIDSFIRNLLLHSQAHEISLHPQLRNNSRN